MSYVQAPTLPLSLAKGLKKSPVFNTVRQKTAAFRGNASTTLTPYAVWAFEFDMDKITGNEESSASTVALFQSLLMLTQGGANLFLFTDPQDSTVSYANSTMLNVTAGAASPMSQTGNGSSTQFQLARLIGGAAADILQNVTVTGLELNGAVIPSAGLSAPSAPTLASSVAGSLAATTYYVKITYVTASGETVASSESSLAVGANDVLVVDSPSATAGATGWNAYVSTSTGTETKQTTSPVAIGTNWTEPTSGLIGGSALPAGNTTGWSINSTGVVTFSGAPKNTTTLTWTGSFQYLCRFDEDTQDMTRSFTTNSGTDQWDVASVKFQSEFV
jgi:hypothetical protein